MNSAERKSSFLFNFSLSGQTTLARIIARAARAGGKCRFVQLSATTSGIKDVKGAIEIAKHQQSLFKKRTILFVDEIHRFNKLQQASVH